MEPHWQPSTSIESLYGSAMWDKLAASLGPRISAGTWGPIAESESHANYYRTMHDLRTEFGASLISAEARESIRQRIEKLSLNAPIENELEAFDQPMPGLDGTIPTASSCVDGFGPYNQWTLYENHTEGGIPDLEHPSSGPQRPSPVATDTPRSISIRSVSTGQETIRTAGVGCWFTVSRSGVASLTVDWYFNAHNYVSSFLGTANGSIELFGSVWGARENRWVDRGGFGVTLTREHGWGFSRYQGDERSLTGPFDATGGGVYYCAAWTRVKSEAVGLAIANVELQANVNPLRVCGPS